MSDKTLENIGEIAVTFAWLEDLTAEFLVTLCDSTSTQNVIRDRMPFGVKCDKLRLLAQDHLAPDRGKRLLEWVDRCKEIAKKRNDAMHLRHAPTYDGKWVRLTETDNIDMSEINLAAVVKNINECYWRGEKLLAEANIVWLEQNKPLLDELFTNDGSDYEA